MAKKTARTQVRYERNDIEAVFKKSPVFFNRIQPVKIINISKQGIAIYSHQVLKPHNHLNITLCFRQGERFLLNGQVVHSFEQQSHSRRDEFVELFIDGVAEPIPLPFKYGIHFDQHYLPFRDYLIESGCKNGFEIQRRVFYRR
ncbi:MAG: hypothetical protein Q8Q50_06335 [Methylobacter sp.]|jgi:hypothetical protein|nr:hypothetical protein [Methylobacter sp.]